MLNEDTVKTTTKPNECQCHDCIQFGLSEHPECTSEAYDELTRFIGTFETYGVWTNMKPQLSSTATIPNDLLKVG